MNNNVSHKILYLILFFQIDTIYFGSFERKFKLKLMDIENIPM